ncbi:ABC transporter ATP-binding protein [Anaerobacillus arseniciselenatis]|uniref:Carnitine transport ATP-binding protein OpuCA n=1 Tax=Anaerobacillus arseniciselenatis TaxID=85682 RepID=A0A1S2LL14_9BACI|nr:ABC transporter ATP-binding protein [Anaerobacillus arseniciselenatis]OIJ12900.1 ABC transporter ATP-binding protein [Anaerobacillus arseniciselenatis]
MSKASLQFENVSFSYENGHEEKEILNTLSFDVQNGEFVSIIGPSGSGKSTIFKLITGLNQPANGEIFINETNYSNRLGKVGYMPQQDLLMPWRTIIENAALPLEIQGMKKREAYDKVRELLVEFGLNGVEHKYPSELSGGMKQRISFLRTVLSGSNVLLLDEPFSSLDAITRLSMQEWLLTQWQKLKLSILFITHDVDEALFLSDRIFVFTESPVRKFVEVNVPLERPREIRDIHTPAVIEVKEQLIEQLRMGSTQ